MSKKSILFDFKNPDVIDKLLRYKAEIDHCSKSSVVENIILDSFLPKNKQLRDTVQEHLIIKESLEQTLIALFDYALCNISSFDIYPLIQFAALLECNRLICYTKNIQNCITQFETMLDIIETNYKERNEKWLFSQLDYDNHLLCEIKDNPSKVRLSELYQVVLDNWELLKGIPITYNFLSNLVSLYNWSNCSSDDYLKLLKILHDISV